MKRKFVTFSEELNKQLNEIKQEEIAKKMIQKKMRNSISLKHKLKSNKIL